jgi:Flp pilus assembly protein TadG
MRRQAKEEGYTLVMIAGLLTVFLGFTAFSVDMGVLYSARASAQRAADSAALAGAFVFVTRGDLNETTTPKQSDVIKENAIKTAATNKMLGASVTITAANVTVEPANRRVTVEFDQNQPTLFARILGENSANIHAKAIAEAASAANATGCLKPVFIPNTALFVGGGSSTQCDACTLSPKQLLIENVSGTLQVTAWAKTQIQSGNNEFLLKPQDPHNSLRPGDFMLIDIPGRNPGDLNDAIANCLDETSVCAQTYGILTGNHAGPVKNAIKDLIGCPSNRDVYLGPGQYQRPDGTIGSTSRSLVTCPIWDVCNATIDGTPFCPAASVPGGTNVQLQIVGFAAVFIEGLTSGGSGTIDCTGNDAIARVVSVSACGASGGGTIDPGETGPFGVPLRLVRAP